MTKQLRFQGHSDDTLGEYGVFDIEIGAFDKPVAFLVGSDGEGAMIVYGWYDIPGGPKQAPACWVIGIQQAGEDLPLPDWPLRFETAENGYSPVLIIDAPDSVGVGRLE